MFEMDEENNNNNKNRRLIDLSIGVINDLYKKYEDDVFITSKIHHYITNQLPVLLDTVSSSRERSKQRTSEHQDEQDKFMQQFLSQYRYYYNTSNEKYFRYNGPHYSVVCEDSILHHIVSTISETRNTALMNWKHKTKVSLLKRIKDQPITKIIPESETIQLVINHLVPSVCATKAEAKFLLTVLGDNILKKNSHLIYFINPVVKTFIRSLNQVCSEKFNVQCINTFKYKYHEKQNEKDCRLIYVQPSCQYTNFCENTISFCGLDMLCVACHYSNKYGSADDFVNDFCQDTDLQQYAFKLKYQEPERIVSNFVKEYLIDFRTNVHKEQVSASPQEEYFMQSKIFENAQDRSLSWKQMQYLWKEYLDIHHYPIGLYHGLCKKQLTENVFASQYNPDTEVFQDVGSSQIPLIQKFLKFWDDTIVEDTNEYAELESEEIGLLFRNWLYYYQNQKKQKYMLKETKIMDILIYFYPELEITNEKYVIHVRNVLWDKDMDIELALSHIRDDEARSMSLYNAYKSYSEFHTIHLTENRIKPLLVSKSYFEHYVRFQYGMYMDTNDTFLDEWFRGGQIAC
jgi:hypothetical protein